MEKLTSKLKNVTVKSKNQTWNPRQFKWEIGFKGEPAEKVIWLADHDFMHCCRCICHIPKPKEYASIILNHQQMVILGVINPEDKWENINAIICDSCYDILDKDHTEAPLKKSLLHLQIRGVYSDLPFVIKRPYHPKGPVTISVKE